MSVEGCSLNFEDDLNFNPIGFPVERNWNGRMIAIEHERIAHSIRGYPMQGWGALYHQINPLKGSAGGSVEAKKDSDGDSSVKGEVHVSVKDDDGNKVSVQAEGSIKNDGDGNVKSEGSIKVSVEKDF